MSKHRIPETDHGIQGKTTVALYDLMQRSLRDRGWIETQALINSGIDHGHALEIGHGPGYLGLEWLKNTQDTILTGVDISPDMTELAISNAKSYGMEHRVSYQFGLCNRLPFEDHTFDAVFTNGSLHEWEDPKGAFVEIWRVMRPGGHCFISDLRRDMNIFFKVFLWMGTRPAAIRPGLISSINAAYTLGEIKTMVSQTPLSGCRVMQSPIGLTIVN